MKFMMMYWGIFFIFILLFGIKYFLGGKILKNSFNNIGIFLVILAFSFLVVAIVTDDPLFESFGVPQEYEWVIGLFLVGLSSWKLYFNPLKERIITVENKLSSLDSGVRIGFGSVKEDLNLIKNKLMKL